MSIVNVIARILTAITAVVATVKSIAQHVKDKDQAQETLIAELKQEIIALKEADEFEDAEFTARIASLEAKVTDLEGNSLTSEQVASLDEAAAKLEAADNDLKQLEDKEGDPTTEPE